MSFAASGVAVFFAGILGAVGDLPSWIRMDVPPVFAIAGGPVMSAVGVLCLIGLWFYIKFLARAIRSVLPKD